MVNTYDVQCISCPLIKGGFYSTAIYRSHINIQNVLGFSKKIF